MSPVLSGSRLDQLRMLRNRIDLEIQVLEDGERLMAKRREAKDRAAKRLANQQSERALREHEVEAIVEAAPADLVRAWAIEQGIPVGDRGRLALDLRRQYLAAQSDEGETA